MEKRAARALGFERSRLSVPNAVMLGRASHSPAQALERAFPTQDVARLHAG